MGISWWWGRTLKGEIPKGITKVIHSETELVSVVGRTQPFNPADLHNVKKIQSEYKVQTLSAFLGKPAPPAAASVDWVKPMLPAEMKTSLVFFDVPNFVFAVLPHARKREGHAHEICGDRHRAW